MASPVRSGMTLGDVRHTEQDYQNPNMLRLRVPTNSVQMDANELGLPSLLTAELVLTLPVCQTASTSIT